MTSAKGSGNAELVSKAERWYQLISKNTFATFEALKVTFSSVDRVEDRLIFNLGSYRLIVGFSFEFQIIYIKHLLTHDEYMRKDWK